MLTEAELFYAFQERGHKLGGDFFMEIPVAIEFLSLCEENDFSTFRIETFFYDGHRVCPDAIVNYPENHSSEPLKTKRNQDALDFLQGIGDPQSSETMLVVIDVYRVNVRPQNL